MKEKMLSVLLFALLGVLPTCASSSLLIHLKDSTVIVCSLAMEPQMSFGKKTITLSSLAGTVGQWNFTDVESWSVGDIEDSIDELKGENAQIRIEGGNLTIAGNKAKNVAIYDLSGRLRTPSLDTAGNKTTISLSGLTKGTYVLKVGKSSVKFMVK